MSNKMSIGKKEKYDFVDVCKFLACICIVGIHTTVFSEFIGGGITIFKQEFLGLRCHFSL